MKKILIVEDEPSVLNLIARIMRTEGYEVVPARNGRDALERVRETPFDFIVCDVRMPDLDGKAFYEKLVRMHSQLKGRIVFITGDTVSADTAAFLRETRAPYLLKPFDLADLKEVIIRILNEKGRARSHEPRSSSGGNKTGSG